MDRGTRKNNWPSKNTLCGGVNKAGKNMNFALALIMTGIQNAYCYLQRHKYETISSCCLYLEFLTRL